MGLRELKIGVMLALIFGAGVFTGFHLQRPATFVPREPSRSRNSAPPVIAGRDEPILAEMKTRFKLTPEQEKQISEILKNWSQQVRQSKQQVMKDRFELFEATMPLIRTNLTADQLPIYDQMVERVRRRQRITRPDPR